MSPSKNHSIPEQFIFGQAKSCPVVVNFKGEPVTSDAGLALIAELVVCQANFARLNLDINAPFFGEHLWFENPNRH
ncbi:MAG: hypothetical protein RM368_36825 [Nostoc sp. DedSLP03]|uniref:hypothetical protein n=1 Tax=Nostoc sp. DedSLP03 TaxID=3075400 RepID=UPI002AD39782|nr:hypothetical protein [Nostoc sp. DedSLP03]MDZ7970436.1 hypothetical protein [Nostoc sp. DedSLP03]